MNDVERKNVPPQPWIHRDAERLRRGVRVAVIGSRAPSAAARQRASQLARRLTGEAVTVVSGLDTIVHRTAIASGGRTIAVLGTPLDQYQPRQNAALQPDIEDLCEGLIRWDGREANRMP